MKKNHFIKLQQFCWLLLSAVLPELMISCATDGYDDETFSSSVQNAQLESPTEDNITITSSTDGATQTISWPVVHGAGGYLVSVIELGDPDVYIVQDSIVDGCAISCKRSSDANYQVSVKTLGNTKYNNAEALSATVKSYNTFTPTYATIPDGSDLYQYFQANAIPTDTVGELCYDLVEGGSYTVSDVLDFGGAYITLRTTSKSNRATVTYGEAGTIRTSAPMTLKNLIVDCSASGDAAVGLSKTPDESILNKNGGSGGYYIISGGAVYITGCLFKGVKGNFLFDNNTKYCIETFLMDNCQVEVNVSEEVKAQAHFYFKQGFVKDFTVKNSSWWSVGEDGFKYFMQYSNGGRLDRAGYDTSEGQSVNFLNNSFYKIGRNDSQWANYSAFVGRNYTWFDIENNIWQDCMPNIAKRILGQRLPSTYDQCTFNYNTYWKDGAMATDWYDDSGNFYDNGTVLTSDPAFKDPANGDLTPQGAEQIQYQTGDPRWF